MLANYWSIRRDTDINMRFGTIYTRNKATLITSLDHHLIKEAERNDLQFFIILGVSVAISLVDRILLIAFTILCNRHTSH